MQNGMYLFTRPPVAVKIEEAKENRQRRDGSRGWKGSEQDCEVVEPL